MSESFKYGTVGGVGGNPGPYPEVPRSCSSLRRRANSSGLEDGIVVAILVDKDHDKDHDCDHDEEHEVEVEVKVKKKEKIEE